MTSTAIKVVCIGFFEGTILEGVVTNHIDGGFSGPIILDLTTDLYSHDHQQLLLPQGTRLLGTVQSVGNAQQRKMFVTFSRAICPDGFSLEFAKYIVLDQIGTTGLATKVNHGYLEAFAAAAAIGGLGGLAQIGNNGSVFSPSTEIRDGISEQSAQEGEQVLNHFLNRLPVITLKEGSRARVYIGSLGDGMEICHRSMNANATSYLAAQPLGSARISQLAMIETSD